MAAVCGQTYSMPLPSPLAAFITLHSWNWQGVCIWLFSVFSQCPHNTTHVEKFKELDWMKGKKSMGDFSEWPVFSTSLKEALTSTMLVNPICKEPWPRNPWSSVLQTLTVRTWGGDLAAIAALSLEARTQCPIHKTCDQSHVSSDGNNWDQRTGGAEKANF